MTDTDAAGKTADPTGNVDADAANSLVFIFAMVIAICWPASAPT